jgi:hypothetical protein
MTMTDEELVARLRDLGLNSPVSPQIALNSF